MVMAIKDRVIDAGNPSGHHRHGAGQRERQVMLAINVGQKRRKNRKITITTSEMLNQQ